MKKIIELLAPGGDIDSIKAAIIAGADAVYCGLNQFNARNRAVNIDFDELQGVIHLAHAYNCKVFLTLNILIVGSEIPFLIKLLNRLVNTGIDAVIVQDFGLFYLLSTYFKDLEIHASTQLNTHNEGQIKFLSHLKASRLNLSRELNIDEISALTLVGHQQKILTEVFVHGSYCISFSGICYMSSVHGANSGNRGRCSQPCRDRYVTTQKGKDFPLNLKDNSAYFDLKKILDAKVDSIKIEGRIKKFDYVYTVVKTWKKQIMDFDKQNSILLDNKDLFKVFNRDFSNGYLKADINKDMFIDNPRDYSIKRFSGVDNSSQNKVLLQDKLGYYEQKDQIIANVRHEIEHLSIAKIPLNLEIFGKLDSLLKIRVQSPDKTFVIHSKTELVQKSRKSKSDCLNYTFLLEKFKAINETHYFIKNIILDNFENDLFLPFKEFTSIKKDILFILNGSKQHANPIDVPFLKKQKPLKDKPLLAVLISSKKDVPYCDKSSARLYFQLPNGLKNNYSDWVDFFLQNKKIIPWFPSVLIGEDFAAAVKLLEQIRPSLIVTNNTGIAYEAFKKKIAWIAGPYLNIVNSFSLISLKENFKCYGSFISNEISRQQIKSIIRPRAFKLYYSIYHPILLLTSRQCLLHQVIGCEKDAIDSECIKNCHKSATLTNLKKEQFFIKKTKGNYHCIYHHSHFLNTDVVNELPGIFSRVLIDLREVKTDTTVGLNKPGIIKLFEDFLNGDPGSESELNQVIQPSTKVQYKKGI